MYAASESEMWVADIANDAASEDIAHWWRLRAESIRKLESVVLDEKRPALPCASGLDTTLRQRVTILYQLSYGICVG